ncbi:MAG: nucleoside monophosphate kinase [gamma proteobacterium symbiont of Bathyaustriella thionipta]|nr:nucleoside monophosphate kinase [gamma proteobacterium symbiont of Bathyaustriella thionipta]
MRIALLGPPGAGKSTQADLIAAQHQLAVLSLPTLLRDAIEADDSYGRLVKLAADAGRPPPDEVIFGVLRQYFDNTDMSKGFVLAGCPRNLSLARGLDALLAELNLHLESVLLLSVDVDEIMERVEGRRNCRSCGQTYNIYIDPPVVDGVCDLCGGRVRQRPDEREEALSNRIRTHEQEAQPLIEYYRSQQRVVDIDGSGNAKTIFKRIEKALKQVLTHPAPPPKLEVVISAKNRKIAERAAAILAGSELEEALDPKSVQTQAPGSEALAPIPQEVEKKPVADKKPAVKSKKKAAKKKVSRKKPSKATKKVVKKSVKAAPEKKPAGLKKKKVVAKKAPKKTTKKKPTTKSSAKKSSKKTLAAPKKPSPKKKTAKKKPVTKKARPGAVKKKQQPVKKSVKESGKTPDSKARVSEKKKADAQKPPSVLQKARSAISKTVGRVTGRKKKT